MSIALIFIALDKRFANRTFLGCPNPCRILPNIPDRYIKGLSQQSRLIKLHAISDEKIVEPI